MDNKIILKNDKLFLKVILIFSVLYIIVSVYIYSTQGIPLFTDNPTEAKVDGFSSGNGWLRRILFQLNFVLIGLILLIISAKKRNGLIILLLIVVSLSLLNGSKSSLIIFLSILFYFLKKRELWSKSSLLLRRRILYITPIIFVAAIFLFLYIAIKESEIENQDITYSIAFRIMEFGDVMLYYTDTSVQEFFKNYNLFDFFQVELNGITGLFRLDTYKQPLGSLMMNEFWSGMLSSDIITGPNTLFFVRGHIFFGYFGGIAYCFIFGFWITKLRWRCLSYNGTSILHYAFWINLFFLTPVFLKEFSLAVSLIFDLVLLLLLIIPLAIFLGPRKNIS